ncbi:hypothetical protein BB558_002503 [Smittium angustum]|uniref:Sister chromatid cohesion protein DCC1 n=1 Tax=Smittium angustum TaxID=133377 RepID=A0A2U1J8Q2_SMIAN|nr:hypothetical protein BB558_002503 [Smittium angustum]
MDTRYLVKRIHTSNTMMAIKKENRIYDEINNDFDVSNTDNFVNDDLKKNSDIYKVISNLDSVCELEPITLGIDAMIKNVFDKVDETGEYRGPEFEKKEFYNGKLRCASLGDFQHLVSANDNTIKSCLNGIPAAYFPQQDAYRMLAKPYVVEILQIILATSIEYDWDIDKIPLLGSINSIYSDVHDNMENILKLADQPNYSILKDISSVTETVLEKFGYRNDTDTFSINGYKVIRYYAKNILESYKDNGLMFYDFLTKWRALLPPMFMKLIPSNSKWIAGDTTNSVLRGLGYIYYENTGSAFPSPFIKYVDKMDNGNSIVDRLKMLFGLQSTWKHNELVEHLEDLLGYSGFNSSNEVSQVPIAQEKDQKRNYDETDNKIQLTFEVPKHVTKQVDRWIVKYAKKTKGADGTVVYSKSTYLK